MKFSALAGNGMQRDSSDAAAVLFFLQKRKKRMGVQIGRTGSSAPTDISEVQRNIDSLKSPQALRASSP